MKPLDMESHLQIKWAPLLILMRRNNKSWCTGSVSFVQSSTKCFSTWILLFPFHRQGNRDRQARLCSSSHMATEEQSRDQSWALCFPGFMINVYAFCISLKSSIKDHERHMLGFRFSISMPADGGSTLHSGCRAKAILPGWDAPYKGLFFSLFEILK